MTAALIGLIVLILSIILHEVAHGYAADALGDPTARLAGRLTLNPAPHVDPIGSVAVPLLLVLSGSPIFFGWAKPVPYNPYNLRDQRWGEAMVAIAGVATNFFIAILFGLLVRFGTVLGLDGAMTDLAGTIAFVNLFLGMFNLIPFPPLDGFSFLRSVLPWHAARALRTFEAYVRGLGPLTLLLFLLVFSYVLAGPFFRLVTGVFGLIVGA